MSCQPVSHPSIQAACDSGGTSTPAYCFQRPFSSIISHLGDNYRIYLLASQGCFAHFCIKHTSRSHVFAEDSKPSCTFLQITTPPARKFRLDHIGSRRSDYDLIERLKIFFQHGSRIPFSRKYFSNIISYFRYNLQSSGNNAAIQGGGNAHVAAAPPAMKSRLFTGCILNRR